MITQLYLALALTNLQGPLPPALKPTDDGWRDVDRIEMIVNEDIITTRALRSDFEQITRNHPIASEKEARKARNEVLRARVRERLGVQGGLDMGVNPKLIEQEVHEKLARMTRDQEGVVGMSAFLQSRDISSTDAQKIIRDRLYADLWDQYVTGEGPGPAERPVRDIYIRPGLLEFHLNNALENAASLKQLGGEPQRVLLQFLVIDAQQAGGLDAARTLADELRERIVTGEDMGALVEQYGTSELKSKRGMLDPVDEARVIQVDNGAGTFLQSAKPGDVSQPLLQQIKERGYWRLVRLIERSPAVVPDIHSTEVQQKLAKLVREDLENVRRENALRDVLVGSYVWPPELVSR